MTADINGLEIYYEKSGRGRPILMLHGNGEDGTIFNELAAKLSRHYTVYQVDSRNHGRSGHSNDISYDAMASDITALVSVLDQEKPFVVGFSDGAITALKAELATPGIFGWMVLLGPNLHPKDFLHEVYMEMEGQYHLNPDPLTKMMLTQPDIDPLTLWKVRQPVLVIGGENDIYKPVTFTTIADALPRGQMRIMYGHDHSDYVIGSDMLYETLRDFFRINV